MRFAITCTHHSLKRKSENAEMVAGVRTVGDDGGMRRLVVMVDILSVYIREQWNGNARFPPMLQAALYYFFFFFA